MDYDLFNINEIQYLWDVLAKSLGPAGLNAVLYAVDSLQTSISVDIICPSRKDSVESCATSISHLIISQ